MLFRKEGPKKCLLGYRIHYYAFPRAEATLAAVGLAGAGFGGLKAAQASFRKFRQMNDIKKPLAAGLASFQPSKGEEGAQ